MKNKELEKNTPWDDLHEECGVFGMYDFDGHDVHCSTADRRAVVLQSARQTDRKEK